jgi:hypothetical protein
VPTFQGLSVADLIRPAGRTLAFPFDVPDALRFYRARNAIYYLFKALADHRTAGGCLAPLKVLVPDYNSGNEVAASATPPAPHSSTTRSTSEGRSTSRTSSDYATFNVQMSCTSFTISDGHNRSKLLPSSAIAVVSGSSKIARWRS